MKNTDNSLLVSMVRDLEMTRGKYNGYSYVTTIRNILVGKESAYIAPFFVTKPYYGMFARLSKDETRRMMDKLISTGELDYIISDKGKKLYCTHEYHDHLCRCC